MLWSWNGCTVLILFFYGLTSLSEETEEMDFKPAGFQFTQKKPLNRGSPWNAKNYGMVSISWQCRERNVCFFLFVHCPSYDCERQSQLWEREREYAPPGILSVRLGHPCSLQRLWHKPRLPDEIITTYRKNRTLSPDAWNTTCPFSTPIESKFTIALRSYVHSRPKIESGVVGTLILYTLPNM